MAYHYSEKNLDVHYAVELLPASMDIEADISEPNRTTICE